MDMVKVDSDYKLLFFAVKSSHKVRNIRNFSIEIKICFMYSILPRELSRLH